ncbi:MAG TPA: hypothetical protein VF727_14105 [Allosphingosinicella sp.]
MTVIGLFGILLGFFAIRIAYRQPTKNKVAFLMLAYALHLTATVIYHRMGETTQIDAQQYYYDFAGSYDRGFAIGTQFFVFVTVSARKLIGGTFLDYFLIYQALGFYGIALLIRIFEETYDELRLPYPPYIYLIALLPSLNFWSTAIGKDPPYLLATCLALWASMRLPRRTVALAGALMLMLIVRPHTALMAIGALSVAVIAGKGMPMAARILLFVAAIAGTAFATVALQQTYAIDVTSAESISQQFERRQETLNSKDAGATAVDAALPIRLLSLYFRPLFFDARDAFALVVSFENLVIVAVMLLLLMQPGDLMRLFRRVFYVRYAMTLALAMTLFLSLSYWNVGLGLRQKWVMLMPAIAVLFVSLRAVQDARRRSAAGQEAQARLLAARAGWPAVAADGRSRPATGL